MDGVQDCEGIILCKFKGYRQNDMIFLVLYCLILYYMGFVVFKCNDNVGYRVFIGMFFEKLSYFIVMRKGRIIVYFY